MFCAQELSQYGLRVGVYETRTAPDERLRARVIQSMTLSVLERRGLLEGLEPSERRTIVHYAGFETIDTSRAATDHRYSLFVRQQVLEEKLAARLQALGVPVHQGFTVTDFTQADDRVVVRVEPIAGGQVATVSAAYMLACDGGKSGIRRALGVPFTGVPASLVGFQAMATIAGLDDTNDGWRRTRGGMYVLGPGRRMAVIDFVSDPAASADLAIDDAYAESLQAVLGPGVTATEVDSLTRFSDNARVADTYLVGRVLLVGDAAHVHPPFGAQGLNLGVQDASNLCWKLGGILTDRVDPGILDSYEDERRYMAQRVIEFSLSQSALMRPDDQTTALRNVVEELLARPSINLAIAERMSGFANSYGPSASSHVGAYAWDCDVLREDGSPARLAQTQLEYPTHFVAMLEADCDETCDAGTAPSSWPSVSVRRAFAGAQSTGRVHWIRPDGYVSACRKQP